MIISFKGNGGGGGGYVLPPATTTTLGGIKVGSGLTIDSGGTLNNDTVPIYILRNQQSSYYADIFNYVKANSGSMSFVFYIDNNNGSDPGWFVATYWLIGSGGNEIYFVVYEGVSHPNYSVFYITNGGFNEHHSNQLITKPNSSEYGPFNKKLHLSSGGTLYFDDAEVDSGGTYNGILNIWGMLILVGAYQFINTHTGPFDTMLCPLYVDSSSTDSGRTLMYPKVIDEPANVSIPGKEIADHKVTLVYDEYKISWYQRGSQDWITGLSVTPNGGGINIDDIPSNELWYRSDNGQTKNLYLDDWATHPAVVSNGYYAKKDLGKIVFATPLTELGAAACYAIGIKGIIIPDNITQLGVSCFAINPLTAITFPDTITNIPFDCLSQCRQLTEVHLGSGTTQLEETAFAYCESLSSLTIPASVTTFGDGLFLNCTALSDIYYQSTMSDWGNISKGTDWNSGCPTITVHCTDGDITI